MKVELTAEQLWGLAAFHRKQAWGLASNVANGHHNTSLDSLKEQLEKLNLAVQEMEKAIEMKEAGDQLNYARAHIKEEA